MIIEIIILVLLVLLAYTWAGYPLLLAFASRSRMPDTRQSEPAAECPISNIQYPTPGKGEPRSVAILLSAYNEEGVIRRRLENLVEIVQRTTDNPPAPAGFGVASGQWTMDIHVGIDGCTDRTAEIAKEFAGRHGNAHVHVFSERRGKVAVLKDLVAASTALRLQSENGRKEAQNTQENDAETLNFERGTLNGRPAAGILVFTDANTIFEPGALEKLLRHFDDPEVGGVCGGLVFCEPRFPLPASSQSDEGVYWRWETGLKEKESAVDSCLGANGAIYAIRRELFWKDIPDNTIIDDFVIGMKVREQGYRMVYEPEATAHEDLPATVVDEWQRRVRIGAGDFQALRLCRKCLLPQYGKFAWMFWSHKVLRWFTPHVLLLVALCSLLALLTSMFHPAHAGQVFDLSRFAGCSMLNVSVRHLPSVALVLLAAILLCGLLGRLLPRTGRRASTSPPARFLRCFDYFLTMQAALFAGFLRFCRGDLKGYWVRTARETTRQRYDSRKKAQKGK